MKILLLLCLIGPAVSRHAGDAVYASDSEMRDVTSRIWSADSQKFSSSQLRYNSNGPKIFDYVDERKLQTGIYPPFIALLDNYIPESGIPEPPCSSCRREESAWLDAVINSRPMQIAWEFLRQKGAAPSGFAAFKEELRYAWFEPYSRSGGPLDSSGFEHVFVGDIKSSKVGGFHNWIQVYLEEKEGNFRFQSLIRQCPIGGFAFRHSWLGYNKAFNSLTFGSSPEVEIALYTVCFRLRMGSGCPIRLGSVSSTITTWDYQGRPLIGSAYFGC